MQQLEHAAYALGWDGHLIPDVEILGVRSTAVVRLRADVHRWRQSHGWTPGLDPSWFRAWSEPDWYDHVPVPAVDLRGFLVPVSRAEQAPDACGALLTITRCAVVLPTDHPYRPWSVMELDYYGIGVVTADADQDNAKPVVLPEDRSAEFGSSLFGRWLLEVLYSKTLDQKRHRAES